jgi:hypothetical protein
LAHGTEPHAAGARTKHGTAGKPTFAGVVGKQVEQVELSVLRRKKRVVSFEHVDAARAAPCVAAGKRDRRRRPVANLREWPSFGGIHTKFRGLSRRFEDHKRHGRTPLARAGGTSAD